MGVTESERDRRRALRVPVRGIAVFKRDGKRTRAMITNLSTTGALLEAYGLPDDSCELELKIGVDSGRVRARTVRVEPLEAGSRVAVTFERLDPALHLAIVEIVDSARSAAEHRPVLVVDDDEERRAALIDQLGNRGMTPLAPRTPLDAIVLLANPHLHVSLCLLGPTSDELRTLVVDSFPWVATADICDDVDATVARAHAAWGVTEMARFARALA